MSIDLSCLVEKITPDIKGVLWITQEDLSLDLNGFNQFNYLFDGLISEYIIETKNVSELKSKIFYTKNFSNNLWLIHLNGSQISSQIDEHMALISNVLDDNNKFIIINETYKKWEDELPKRYPQYKFISL
jgi:hypothetical protein